MNKPNSRLGVLLIFAVFLSLTPACRKDKPISNPEPVNNNLILAEQEAAPYQFITVQMPAGMSPVDPSAQSIAMTIGGVNVTASRLVSQELDAIHGQGKYYSYMLAVPELSPGKYKITLGASGGRTGEAEITIKALLVTVAPGVYIDDYNHDLQQKNQSDIIDLDARVVDGSISQTLADSIKDIINKSYAELTTELALLTPEEKQIYVQMVEANKHWIDDYNQIMSKYPLVGKDHDTVSWDCYEHKKWAKNAEYFGQEREAEEEWLKFNQCQKKYAVYRQAETNAYAKRVQTAYEQAKKEAASRSGWLSAGRAFVKTFVSSAAKGLIEEKFGNDVFNEPSTPVSMDDLQNKKGTLTFEPAKEYDLGALLTVVNLNRTDIGIPGFKQIIDRIDEYNQIWASLKDYMPFTLEKTVPARQVKQICVSGYTIDQITDSRVHVTMTKGGKGKLVKFTVDAGAPSPLTFKFRMVHKSGAGEVEKTFDAELSTPISITGKWNILFWKSYEVYMPKQSTDSWTFNSDGTCTFVSNGNVMSDMQSYTLSSDYKTITINGASGPIVCDIQTLTTNSFRFQSKDGANLWSIYR